MSIEWTALDSWIVIIGGLGAVACALVGSFLVLRQLSMMGDAISHAVLPGLAIAFIMTGSRTSLAMFVGAAVTGVLTAVFTQWIHRMGSVDRGASMGIVFTSLFALGLILLERGAHQVDLDPGCVLYGAIEMTPLDIAATWSVGSVILEIPRAALVLGLVLMLNGALILLLYKEFRISAFDPALATALGFRSGLMHYVLMVMVAITTVAAFEVVGSILVIAMLIVPPAAAHLLTDRLGTMIFVSMLIAGLCAVLGHVAAITLPQLIGFSDTSTAGMMAVVAGVIFLIVATFAPRHGILVRRVFNAKLMEKSQAVSANGAVD